MLLASVAITPNPSIGASELSLEPSASGLELSVVKSFEESIDSVFLLGSLLLSSLVVASIPIVAMLSPSVDAWTVLVLSVFALSVVDSKILLLSA